MTAPANRWKLGLFVVAGSAFGLGGAAFLGARELHRASHPAYAYFDEALTGLEEGSPVKFRGVTIGVVERIRVASDKKHLEVQAALYDDYLRDLGLDVDALDGAGPLPENLRAQVVMSWVTSTAFIQVDYFPDPASGPQLLPFPAPSPSKTLRTVPSTAKSLESAVREILGELPVLASSVRDLVELLRTELSAARLPELSRRLQAVLAGVEQQLGQLEQQDTITVATRALEDLRTTSAMLRDDQAPLATALRAWTELGRKLEREVEAARLAATTADLRAAAGALDGLSTDVGAELLQLRGTLAAVERLAELLERDPGALLRGRGASRSPLGEGK